VTSSRTNLQTLAGPCMPNPRLVAESVDRKQHQGRRSPDLSVTLPLCPVMAARMADHRAGGNNCPKPNLRLSPSISSSILPPRRLAAQEGRVAIQDIRFEVSCCIVGGSRPYLTRRACEGGYHCMSILNSSLTAGRETCRRSRSRAEYPLQSRLCLACQAAKHTSI
jgi:hypothetical protein